MITQVQSDRIHLRSLGDADCTLTYVGWLNDPEVHRFLETRYAVQTLDSVRDFVRAVNGRNDEHLFGIFLEGNATHIGNIKVGPVRPRHLIADVSLFIGARDYWGKGYAAEAITAVSRHAFQALGVRKLCASMYAPNEGSRRAFIRAGYRQEGLRRAHMLLAGEAVDLFEMGLVETDLP